MAAKKRGQVRNKNIQEELEMALFQEELEMALCTLVDWEHVIKKALAERGHNPNALHDMCDALRLLVDGE